MSAFDATLFRMTKHVHCTVYQDIRAILTSLAPEFQENHDTTVSTSKTKETRQKEKEGGLSVILGNQ